MNLPPGQVWFDDCQVASRGICKQSGCCRCDLGQPCIADNFFGRHAKGAVDALRANHRLIRSPKSYAVIKGNSQ